MKFKEEIGSLLLLSERSVEDSSAELFPENPIPKMRQG
jgi:hypothetical protein